MYGEAWNCAASPRRGGADCHCRQIGQPSLGDSRGRHVRCHGDSHQVAAFRRQNRQGGRHGSHLEGTGGGSRQPGRGPPAGLGDQDTVQASARWTVLLDLPANSQTILSAENPKDGCAWYHFGGVTIRKL
jgi:hypothetical protein